MNLSPLRWTTTDNVGHGFRCHVWHTLNRSLCFLKKTLGDASMKHAKQAPEYMESATAMQLAPSSVLHVFCDVAAGCYFLAKSHKTRQQNKLLRNIRQQ